MVPVDHAKLHVRDFGGKVEDYLPLDEFIDSTKAHCSDYRHRAILHSTFGIILCERIFGTVIKNSDGVEVPVRELARRHVMQDCSTVPTLKEWLDALENQEGNKFNNPSKSDLRWLRKTNYDKRR